MDLLAYAQWEFLMLVYAQHPSKKKYLKKNFAYQKIAASGDIGDSCFPWILRTGWRTVRWKIPFDGPRRLLGSLFVLWAGLWVGCIRSWIRKTLVFYC
jgi:hypothetical protein